MPSIFGKSGPTAGRAKSARRSIRGAISAPIPIPTTPDDDEFPFRNPGSAKVSVTADDEFPIRTPGAGIASPLPPADDPGLSAEEPVGSSDEREHGHEIGVEGKQEQGAVPVLAATSSPDSTSTSDGNRTGVVEDIRPEPPSTPPPEPPTGPSTPSRSSSRPQSRSPLHRASPRRTSLPGVSPLKDSPPGVSPRRTSPPGVSSLRDSPPTRRVTNPVLNTVRYSVASDSPSKQPSQSKESPQRKKSTLRSALGRLFGRGKKKSISGGGSGSASSAQHRSDPPALVQPKQVSPKRSASVPISEFDRPLRSHSIGPDDIMAIESARSSLHAEAAVAVGGPSTEAGGRRRAVTTGGRMLLRPHFHNQGWGGIGLSPRPASAQGRASRLGEGAESEDPDEIGRAITSDSSNGLRRRSRSLGGLQDFAGVLPSGRRRSDEIRYWRQSYDPGPMSPLSSNPQEDIDDTGMVDGSAPASPAVERPPKTPPQPFNFGLLSKEMVGMKITQAANMDLRLGDLESRTLHLEQVVGKLGNSVPGFKGGVNTKEPAWPGYPRQSLESDTHSEASIGETRTGTASLSPPSLAIKTQSSNRPSTRPTSTATVRGTSSMPLIGQSAGRSGNGYPQDQLIAHLKTDLDAERAARQALEAQVKKLSERLNTLSTTMFAMVRGPSESRSQERLTVSMGPSSPLLPPPKTLVVPPRQEQPHSVFEEDEDEEGAETLTGTQISSLAKADVEEGELTEDDFQTPREDNAPLVCGAFGEELRPDDEELDEDDPKRKKAARTLSLSQLTLGKGQRTRI